MKILKPGCGRGEHLRIFQSLGLDAYGLDMSPEAPKLADDLNTSVCNLGSENLPLATGFQDVEVYEFRQLPMTWKYPWLNYFCAFIGSFISVGTTILCLRWPCGLMQIGEGRKPHSN